MDRGGAEAFFIIAMGMNQSAEEMKQSYTQLEFEMKICSELLGGLLHGDYENLSHLEKMKWEMYLQKQIKRNSKPKVTDNKVK